MNSSFGNFGTYGEDKPDALATFAQLVPGVSQLLEKVADPVRDVQLIEGQLAAAKRRGASLAEIEELENKLTAAQRRMELTLSREKSQTQWSNIGKIAAISGIGLIAIIGVYYGVKTVRAARS
jgi:hypothetical protein